MKEDIKCLADALRKTIGEPARKAGTMKGEIKDDASKGQKQTQDFSRVIKLIENIQVFDCSSNKHMLHPRLDSKTISLLNGFKLATGIDMNKVISFSIDAFFASNPELKKYIKHTLNNIEL